MRARTETLLFPTGTRRVKLLGLTLPQCGQRGSFTPTSRPQEGQTTEPLV